MRQQRRTRYMRYAGDKCSAPKLVDELIAPKFVGKVAQGPQRYLPTPLT